MKKTWIAVVGIVVALGLASVLKADLTTHFSYSKQGFINQTASIPTTTLFTPLVEGDYQIFVMASVVGRVCPNACAAVSVEIDWVDEVGMNSVTFSRQGGQSLGQPPLTIHVLAGQPVTIKSTYFPNSTLDPYNIHLVVIGE